MTVARALPPTRIASLASAAFLGVVLLELTPPLRPVVAGLQHRPQRSHDVVVDHVDRAALRQFRTSAPAVRVGTRNPFHMPMQEPAHEPRRRAAPPSPASDPPAAPGAFPALVGIAEERGSTGSVFTAVLVLGDRTVRFAVAGDTIGDYRIDEIRPGLVLATNRVSNLRSVIELR